MRSQSDYNESRASVVSRNSVYSDLNLSSALHPVYKDFLPSLDIDAVKTSIKNLVLTNSYERPFQPEINGKISELLFENAGPFVALEIKDRITALVTRYEPRVANLSVDVVDDVDANSYFVSIRFTVINNREAELTFYLTRIR